MPAFEPPPLVAANADAAAYWARYVANATRGGLVDADLPILARLCVALAYADEANRAIASTGLLVQHPQTKLPTPNPYLAVLEQQTAMAARLTAILEPKLRGW